MEENMWFIAIVGIVLGAGGISSIIPLLKLRQDKESSLVLGAQAAVVSLTAALKQSETRVTKLEVENRFLTEQMEKLIRDVESAKQTMRELTKKLNETKAELDIILSSQQKGEK